MIIKLDPKQFSVCIEKKGYSGIISIYLAVISQIYKCIEINILDITTECIRYILDIISEYLFFFV